MALRTLAVLLLWLCLALSAWAAVDINTATEAELQNLPGIGPTKARAIVEDRRANGPFRSLEELGRVKGIGEKTVAELKGAAMAGAQTPPASPQGEPAGGISWTPVIAVVVLVAGGIALLLLRRRGAVASAPTVPPRTTAAAPGPAPDVRPPPAPPARPPGAPPRPAGGPPKPAGGVPRDDGGAPPPAPPGMGPRKQD